MKNYAALILSVAVLVGAALGLSSCKDDEPPVPPKLSFAESAMTVNEDIGVIDVELVLDKPYSRDLNVEYTLGGTASDQDAVGTANADYEVVGTHGVVVIESGATSGTIKIEIYSDAAFEDDETIEISIIDGIDGDQLGLTILRGRRTLGLEHVAQREAGIRRQRLRDGHPPHALNGAQPLGHVHEERDVRVRARVDSALAGRSQALPD